MNGKRIINNGDEKMNEHINRTFIPETDEEENNIHDMRKLIYEMDGCIRAYVKGSGDYHYIEAIFFKKIILNEQEKQI